MLRPGLTALLLLPLACCNPGDPGDTAGSTGGATNNPSTGTTSTASASSSTSTDPTDGSASASASTSTTTTTTTTDATSDSTAATTQISGITAVGSTGPDDTGGPVVCAPATGDYGDCATPLGWAYDGTECRPVSGCDCAPDCDKFFAAPAECALTCAAAGHCNEDRLEAEALAQDPVMQGNLCDEIAVCPDSPDLKAIFEEIFGVLSCEGGGFCDNGEKCTGIFQNMLGPDDWLKTCAATLVQGSGDVLCVVYGP